MTSRDAIDDKLLEEARVVGKHATNEAVVNEVLAEYIQRRKQAKIIELFHTVEYDPNVDYKMQRKER